MIDLGAWASETYRAPVAENPDRENIDSESADNRRERGPST
jgi:endogenous inhibitor of DNA gyrase (YacG/DUF329 family)